MGNCHHRPLIKVTPEQAKEIIKIGGKTGLKKILKEGESDEEPSIIDNIVDIIFELLSLL